MFLLSGDLRSGERKADKEDSDLRRKSGETPRRSRTDFQRFQIFECGPARPFINLSGLSCSRVTQPVSKLGSHLERADFSANPAHAGHLPNFSSCKCKDCNAAVQKAARQSLTLLRHFDSALRSVKGDRLRKLGPRMSNFRESPPLRPRTESPALASAVSQSLVPSCGSFLRLPSERRDG